MIFENTHAPIIDKETWELANKLRSAAKRCVCRIDGEMHPLTGLMFCPDCGAKMYHQRRRPTSRTPYNEYVCATYRKHRSNDCTAHRISKPAIEELILITLRTVVTYAIKDEEGFRQRVTGIFPTTLDSEVKTKRKRLTACEKRTAELDKIIKKLFEEHTLGNLTEKRFNLLSVEYENEQENLEREIAELHAGIDSKERADKFLALTKCYTDFTELTTPMLNEFIDRVLVHEREEKKVKYTRPKAEFFQIMRTLTWALSEYYLDNLADEVKKGVKNRLARSAQWRRCSVRL